jgi:hypothetical protein
VKEAQEKINLWFHHALDFNMTSLARFLEGKHLLGGAC